MAKPTMQLMMWRPGAYIRVFRAMQISNVQRSITSKMKTDEEWFAYLDRSASKSSGTVRSTISCRLL